METTRLTDLRGEGKRPHGRDRKVLSPANAADGLGLGSPGLRLGYRISPADAGLQFGTAKATTLVLAPLALAARRGGCAKR
jgi:hypothetical protein